MGFYKLDEKTVKGLQKKSFAMLMFFKTFCEKHSLEFFLCGGCCIGAVRSGGFIPWDDDVDVFMPRRDYERLIEIFNDECGSERYFLQVSQKGRLTKNLFATICDCNTTFIKSYQSDLDINHGIVLDILPIDGCPSSKIKRGFQMLHSLLYSLYLIGEAPLNNGKIIELVGKTMLFLVPSRSARFRIAMHSEKKMTRYDLFDCEYATELCSGVYYMRKKYKVSDFKEALFLDFEGEKMPVPKGYDDYLTKAFGDYMSLPPERERECHHELEFVDIDNSYIKYRKKYYLLNGGNKK